MDYTFFDILLWFYVYSFLGWVYESIVCSISERKLVNRGFLNGPYCPIYGTGAIFFILSTNPIENFALRFIAGGLIACLLEFVTSLVLEKIFHARWWNYSRYKLNIGGRVCFVGFLVFGTFAALMPYLHGFIENLSFAIPVSLRSIITAIITIIFFTDLCITNAGLIKFNHVLSEYQKAIDKHYLQAAEFIKRSRHSFEIRIKGGREKIDHVLSFQQRRILESFPSFVSVRYTEATKRLRKLNSESRKSQKTAKSNKK